MGSLVERQEVRGSERIQVLRIYATGKRRAGSALKRKVEEGSRSNVTSIGNRKEEIQKSLESQDKII